MEPLEPLTRRGDLHPVLPPHLQVEKMLPLVARCELEKGKAIILANLLHDPIKIRWGQLHDHFPSIGKLQDAVEKLSARKLQNGLSEGRPLRPRS
jgi:hypothetical protein